MPTAEALFPSLDRRRRRPDPLASISAAVSSGVAAPPAAVPLAISEGLASTATPTYRPRSIAARRQEALPSGVANEAREQLLGAGRGRGASLERIRKQRMATVAVPEIVPPQLRRTVAVQGQRLNDALAEAGSDLSGPEYLAKLIQFESGWDKNAEGPPIPDLGGVTAKRLGQFIPSTRDDILSRYGVDAYGPAKQQIKAASLHASGKAGYGPLYAGYNPGYSSTDPIPATDAGTNVKVRVPGQALRRAGDGSVTSGAAADPTRVPKLIGIGKKAERKFDVEAREQPFFDPVDPVHSTNSMHYSGDAIDFQGSSDQLGRLNEWLARKYGSQTDEMFYDPGINIADGQETGAIGGHGSHVHFGLDDGRVGSEAYGVGGYASGDGGSTYTGPAVPMATGNAPPMTSDRDTFRGASGSTPRSPLASRAAMPTRPGEEGEQSLLDLLAQESVDRRRIRTGRRTV